MTKSWAGGRRPKAIRGKKMIKMSDHYTRAMEILAEVDTGGLPPSLLIKVAEVHAILALVEVIMDGAQPTVSVGHGTVVVRGRDDH
jgi:hypothetical protein